ncbi:MAG TPA: hypothetical protein VGH32_07470, partial [Pirellulales bacterium]
MPLRLKHGRQFDDPRFSLDAGHFRLGTRDLLGLSLAARGDLPMSRGQLAQPVEFGAELLSFRQQIADHGRL